MKIYASKEYVQQELMTKISIPDSALVGQTIAVKSVDENGKPIEFEAVDMQESDAPVLYVATDPEHGIIPEASADNTKAMQNLIQKVYDNGGGIIWLPVGTYGFDRNSNDRIKVSDDFYMCLRPMSGVSIIGESLTETVIKVYGVNSDTAWIANQVTKSYGIDPSEDDEFLHGFTYQNFTVDMSESDMAVDADGNPIYSSAAKAFGMKALRNCVFRDLRILESPATGFGIDMLDNVVIDSLYLYKCGKRWQYGNQGGAGIGIGTGRWTYENFIVRNCMCIGCGHFGIFVEDQGLFRATPEKNTSIGKIIANNIVRHGKHYGIGVRGTNFTVVTGNNICGNKGGIYLDYGATKVTISNNAITQHSEAGVLFGTEDIYTRDNFEGFPCERVTVFGNDIDDNQFGVWIQKAPLYSKIQNNIYIGNDVDYLKDMPIDESKIKQGVYINDVGEEAANARSWLYDEFIDLDTTMITWTPIGETADGINKNPRIAIYDENKGFLHRINGDYDPSQLNSIMEEALVAAGKATNFRYIKFGDNCSGEIVRTMKLCDTINPQNQFALTDESTGIKYKLSISDGKLTMTEVTA